MKQPVVLFLAGAALLTIGYWAGSANSSSQAEQGKITAGMSAAQRTAAATSKKSLTAGEEKQVRTFQAGRPFPPGGAKAWLLSLAELLGHDGHDDFDVAVIDLAQTFMTMDEASATEVAEALKEIMALVEAGDPAIKRIKDGDDMARGALLATVFRLSQLNPDAAVRFVKAFPDGGPSEMARLVFARLASQNPAQAESMLNGLEGDQRRNALEGILDGLTGKDPAAAVAVAEKYPDELRSDKLRKVIERMMKRDPEQGIAAAIRLTENKKDPDPDINLLHSAMYAWMNLDKAAAAQWAGNYTGAGHTTVQAMLVREKAQTDPHAAMADFARLQQTAADQKELTGAASAIASKLAEKDIPSAQAWVTSLPPGPAHEEAMAKFTQIWVNEDATAASEWIATFPAGHDKDHAAANLAGAITKRDPAAAFEWASNIQDKAMRRRTIDRVMNEWMQQDPDAAKAASQSLPPDKALEAVRK